MHQALEFRDCLDLAILVAAYLVVQPLKAQIANLAKSMDVLSSMIQKLQEAFHGEKVHITEIDERAKSAHKRVDTLEKHVEELQQRCINCNCRSD